MGADKNHSSKARRVRSIPEDDIPIFRYYNGIVTGIDVLFELTANGVDLEYTERLKRIFTLVMELAGSPDTYPSPVVPAAERYYADGSHEFV